MIKSGVGSGSISSRPHGVNIASAVYGKVVKLLYGLVQTAADFVWYNDWQRHDHPVNQRLADVTGASEKKKSGKKGNVKFYSCAGDFVLGHSPILGVFSAWYNNQKFSVKVLSASGFVQNGMFSFQTSSGDSRTDITQTIPGTPFEITAPNFVSDISVQLTSNGKYLQSIDPSQGYPGNMQYSVDRNGLYTFNTAQTGQSVKITYRQTNTGTGALCAGILAASVNDTYVATFNDFGGVSRTQSGHWDIPLWNTRFPEPGNISSTSFHARDPYSFSYLVQDNYVTVTVPSALEGLPITVYYGIPIILKSDGSHYSSTITPLGLLNLEFEQQFASGSEYTKFPDQRVLQTWVAGLGSAQFDLGAANAVPNINYEVIGSYTLWPNGDCDVADIITDIIASGPILYYDTTWTATADSFEGAHTPDLAVDGNIETYWASTPGEHVAADLPHTLLIDLGAELTFGYIEWVVSTQTAVNPYTGVYTDWPYNWPTAISVYTSNDNTNWTHRGDFTYDFGYSVYGVPRIGPFPLPIPTVEARYIKLVVTDTYGGSQWLVPYQVTQVLCREIRIPVLNVQHGVNCNDYPNGGFVNPGRPNGNGALIEDIEPLRNWCRANSITVAMAIESQRSAKDLLDELLMVGNSAGVYSGAKLKVIPYDEVGAAGNGAVYTPPTTPVATLTDKDFEANSNGDLVCPERAGRTSCDNTLSIEHIERDIDYSHNITSDVDTRAVTLYGPRKGGTLTSAGLGTRPQSGSMNLLSVHSAKVAQALASIAVKRNAAGPNDYSFTVKAERLYLEAMDVVLINDVKLGLENFPVRLSSVRENANRSLACKAKAFQYGLNHPSVRATTIASGSLVVGNVSPGLVNPPVIFQPTLSMIKSSGGNGQIWFAVSGADSNYGGCVCYVSTDGGASYPKTVGFIPPCTMGLVAQQTFPTGSDPDIVNTLYVDLTQSRGSLATQTQLIADTFSDPCYLESATAAFQDSFSRGNMNLSTPWVKFTGDAPWILTATAAHISCGTTWNANCPDATVTTPPPYGNYQCLMVLNNAVQPTFPWETWTEADNVTVHHYPGPAGSYVNTPLSANQWAQIAFVSGDDGGMGSTGVTVRGDAAGQNFYFVGYIGGDLTYGKVVNKVMTVVGHHPSGVVAPEPGDIFGLQAVGTTINIVLNNVIIATFTDSDLTSGFCGHWNDSWDGDGTSHFTLDNFACGSMDSGSGSTQYEIVCPTEADLTAQYKYSLDTYIRRGSFGTTISQHTVGQKFAVLDGSVLQVDIPDSWLGKTLYFKFVAYNLTGGQANNLDDCVAYPFTPGQGGVPAVLFQVNGN